MPKVNGKYKKPPYIPHDKFQKQLTAGQQQAIVKNIDKVLKNTGNKDYNFNLRKSQ